MIQGTKEALAARKESAKEAEESAVEVPAEEASPEEEAVKEPEAVTEETVPVNGSKVETFLDEEEEDNE